MFLPAGIAPFELQSLCQSSGGPITSQIVKREDTGKEEASACPIVPPVVVVADGDRVTVVSLLTLAIDIFKGSRLADCFFHHLRSPQPVDLQKLDSGAS